MEFSLWVHDIEDVIPVCRELGIGIVYRPLGRGFLGRKATTASLPTESLLNMHPRFTGENLEKNKVIFARFADQAAKHACSPPQLALAWLFHQGEEIILIPKTIKVKKLENNIGSFGLKFTEEELKEICDVVSIDEVGGRGEFAFSASHVYKVANTPRK
ncbi:hypothetical protein SLA2020_501360 [Shorea laevis]